MTSRLAELREQFAGKRVMLGVDRLDYTKGIRHRLKAYGELLRDGDIEVGDAVLVQVASPSRERVAAYMQLRDEIELTVGRLNGTYSTIIYLSLTSSVMPRQLRMVSVSVLKCLRTSSTILSCVLGSTEMAQYLLPPFSGVERAGLLAA